MLRHRKYEDELMLGSFYQDESYIEQESGIVSPTTPRDFFGSGNKSSKPLINSNSKKIFNYQPLLENKPLRMKLNNHSITKLEAN